MESVDGVARLREALSLLHREIEVFTNSQGIVPAPGSQADDEVVSFAEPEAVHTVHSQAAILIEVAAEQLTAFVKMITPPFETIAPWACSRGLLEATALASWLLDPGISVQMRVGRSLALRYEGLRQQEKFARVDGSLDEAFARKRMDEVESGAIALGFPHVKNRKGKRVGIGQKMPASTEIVRLMLSAESQFRLMSAVVHGHHWAIHQISYSLVGRPACEPWSRKGEALALIKSVNPLAYQYLALCCAESFARPVWYQCLYYGWSQESLIASLDSVFDHLGTKRQTRFVSGKGGASSAWSRAAAMLGR